MYCNGISTFLQTIKFLNSLCMDRYPTLMSWDITCSCTGQCNMHWTLSEFVPVRKQMNNYIFFVIYHPWIKNAVGNWLWHIIIGSTVILWALCVIHRNELYKFCYYYLRILKFLWMMMFRGLAPEGHNYNRNSILKT